MMSCDYNGWSDVPEGEREDLEAFEAFQALQDRWASVLPLVSRPDRSLEQQRRAVTPPAIPGRKAA